jgi:hypothetical protein
MAHGSILPASVFCGAGLVEFVDQAAVSGAAVPRQHCQMAWAPESELFRARFWLR